MTDEQRHIITYPDGLQAKVNALPALLLGGYSPQAGRNCPR